MQGQSDAIQYQQKPEFKGKMLRTDNIKEKCTPSCFRMSVKVACKNGRKTKR